MRRFEMIEGGSAKFWEIEQQGPAFTVRFGRIGTAGQAKTTTCGSADEALAEVAKLVREKTKKGYQEIGAAPTWRPPTDYGNDEHVQRFMNYLVTDFDPAGAAEGEGDDERPRHAALRELDRRVYRVATDYEGGSEAFDQRLAALLADPKVGQLRGLVIGNWFGDSSDDGSAKIVVKTLVEHAASLPALEGIFFGDVLSEESEISWLHQTDLGPLLRAFPRLKELVVRGGGGLRFSTPLRHEALTTLTVQSGGLPGAAVRDLAHAELPALRNLVLWLGVEDYGGDATVADVQPILDGAFPALEHLALANTELADALAKAVSGSAVLEKLKGLDLSMGTLTDHGAFELISDPRVAKLKLLNLRHHFLSAGMMKKLRGLGPTVDLSDAGDPEDEDERYCEVTE